MEVAGDRIDTPLFSDGQEATEAWVGKEVVFIVGQATLVWSIKKDPFLRYQLYHFDA